MTPQHIKKSLELTNELIEYSRAMADTLKDLVKSIEEYREFLEKQL